MLMEANQLDDAGVHEQRGEKAVPLIRIVAVLNDMRSARQPKHDEPRGRGRRLPQST